MRRLAVLGVALMVVMLGLAPVLLARPGGGGKGGGGGGRGKGGWGWGGWMNGYKKPAPQVDPKKLQEELDRKVAKYVGEGWSALRAGDTAAAYDAFSDAHELNPNSPGAHFGLGLTHAARGDFSQAGTELEAANKLKADPRLVPFNLAVSYARSSTFGRSAVLLNRLINESKPMEELHVNAQLTLLSNLTEAQKKQIAVLPELKKSVNNASHVLASTKYPGKARWGLSWAPVEQVDRLRASGKKEVFPDQLPFLMPGDFPLPEKGQWNPINVLLQGATSLEGTAIAAVDPKPVVVATATSGTSSFDPKPAGNSGAPFKLGGNSETAPVIVKTTEAAAPVTPTPAAPVTGVTASAPMTRTVRGAAFAVTPDLLLTAARLVVNAKEIQLQNLEGRPCDATVVAMDKTTGIALIKANGAAFKPMSFAEAPKPGAVGLAAFVKPSVFNPDLDIIAATLIGPADKPLLRCTVHPRSAGSPFFDDEGHVMGMLIAARDDAPDKLPVVTVEVLRKFAAGKFTPVTATAGEPEDSVLEMTVIRQD